jgi:tetratricopeptide (TPR) repeat protein
MNCLRHGHTIIQVCGVLIVVAASVPALAQAPAAMGCGSLTNSYGPFDYRTERAKLKRVEDYHFNAGVESLIRGQSSSKLGGDISYLMRTSPNHHRGLLSIVRLAQRERSPHPSDLQYSVECYFERAMRFARDDTIVRVIYAQYLQQLGRKEDAARQLDGALAFAGDNGFSHYNIGLAFFELGQYDRALEQAHKAAALGFERSELAEMLKRANHWKDPTG